MESARQVAWSKLCQDCYHYAEIIANKFKHQRHALETLDDESGGKLIDEVYEIIRKCLTPGYYKPERGVPFSAYFYQCIRNAISRAWRRSSRVKNMFSEQHTKLSADEKEEIEEEMRAIDKAFCSMQERVKPFRSALLTVHLYSVLVLLDMDASNKKYTFVDYGILENIRKTGRKRSQRDIAKIFGKHEAAASRSLTQVLDLAKKVYKKNLNEKC